jgi:hypothetical protein
MKARPRSHTLAAEPDPLQHPLLGQVLVGDDLDPVGQGRREQVVDQQPLRRRPHPAAAVLGEQQDADLQAGALGPPALMVRQLTIPARVPSGRATASWVLSGRSSRPAPSAPARL